MGDALVELQQMHQLELKLATIRRGREGKLRQVEMWVRKIRLAEERTAAQQRLAEWEKRADARDWRPLWVWQANHGRAWPVFVRLSDAAKDLKGLQDGEYIEVLEWEPGTEPQAGTPLRVITGAPPARQPGLLDRPANFKVS